MEWFDKITHNNNYRWIYVDIDLGNFCTYACSYCPDEAHNGSVPWLEISTLTVSYTHLTLPTNREV